MSSTQEVATTIASYTNPSRFNSRHCKALALQLQRVAPKNLEPAQKQALDALVARGLEVEEIRKNRARTSAPSLQRPRHATASAWTALNSALTALTGLPADLGPEAELAANLVGTLFPEGTAFGTADAVALWTHSGTLLERIEEEALRAKLESLVNPKLLVAVERAHAWLGEAIGVEGDQVELPARRALFDAVSRFSFAISAYARALSIGVDETTDEAFEQFKRALAPIDPMRAVGKPGASDELDEEDAPTEPTEDPDAPYVPASDDPIDNPFIT
ncbi:MAG: hypothetical protein H6723_00855 [Sandaracinus sp.]|nr:hypothetical protein [Sandaracinus sp.]